MRSEGAVDDEPLMPRQKCDARRAFCRWKPWFLPQEMPPQLIFVADFLHHVAWKNEGMIQVNTCGILASCVFCLGFGAPATPPAGDPPNRLRWTDSWVHSNWWMVLTWISLRWWANLNSATYIHIYIYILIYLEILFLKMWRCAVFSWVVSTSNWLTTSAR